MMMEARAVLDEELAEIVANLRAIGGDIAEIEVKRASGGLPKTVRETLSAFANTRGGVLILGLDEKTGFGAVGVSDPAKMSADLASLCSTEMDPPLRPLITPHVFEGAQVVVAEIPALDQALRPCFYRGAGISQGSFIRVGDGDRRLTSYEVQMMLSSRGQPKEDERAVEGTTVDDLDPASVATLTGRLRQARPRAFAHLDEEDVLRRARVLVDQDQVSLAGLLALGSYPQERFPQLMVSFVHYPTSTGPVGDGTRFLDNAVFEGPIPVIVEDALAVLRRNMSRRAVITGIGREDLWEYPDTALREAITNALAHRDYSTAALGTQVQIEMYPDRLAIRNPGGLFGPVTVDTLGEEGLSSSRNATLLKLLEDVTLPDRTHTVCENRGSGIRSMLDALRRAGMNPPRFDDRVSSFTVTFPNHSLLSDEAIAWLDSLNQTGLSDSQRLALVLFRDEPGFDNRAYREATRVDSRIATAELQDMVARELLEQTGSRRWARYKVRETPQPSRLRADRRPEILAALGDSTMSRSDLATATGLSDPVVRYWLGRMREEGMVDLVGTSPRSKHVRYRRNSQNPLFEG